ncbi:MAG: carbohydrate ABC transporter permease [Saccharofermentanales bacterium]|jgi:putative aldouronate transport system permease protein
MMVYSRSDKIVKTLANLVMIVLSAGALLPFVVLFMASISDNDLIVRLGYTIWPRGFSLEAYAYIFDNISVIGRAYLITVFVTIVGTFVSLLVTNTAAYALSHDRMPLRRVLMFYIVFTMLFNGGLVPTYYVYSQIVQIRNTLPALIVPNLLCSAFNVILVRNYYRFSIPSTILDSARIDGAGEFRIFLRIMLPLSLPITATVGLLTAIIYWNDWQNGLYYLSGPEYFSIQQVLRVMSTDLMFLANNSTNTGVTRNLPLSTIRMAIAAIGIIPLLLVFPFFEKYFVKGITIGAVKE